jgi:hypothetical protein
MNKPIVILGAKQSCRPRYFFLVVYHVFLSITLMFFVLVPRYGYYIFTITIIFFVCRQAEVKFLSACGLCFITL